MILTVKDNSDVLILKDNSDDSYCKTTVMISDDPYCKRQ